MDDWEGRVERGCAFPQPHSLLGLPVKQQVAEVIRRRGSSELASNGAAQHRDRLGLKGKTYAGDNAAARCRCVAVSSGRSNRAAKNAR